MDFDFHQAALFEPGLSVAVARPKHRQTEEGGEEEASLLPCGEPSSLSCGEPLPGPVSSCVVLVSLQAGRLALGDEAAQPGRNWSSKKTSVRAELSTMKPLWTSAPCTWPRHVAGGACNTRISTILESQSFDWQICVSPASLLCVGCFTSALAEREQRG